MDRRLREWGIVIGLFLVGLYVFIDNHPGSLYHGWPHGLDEWAEVFIPNLIVAGIRGLVWAGLRFR